MVTLAEQPTDIADPKFTLPTSAVDIAKDSGDADRVIEHHGTIWNASASVPIGLYAVHPAGMLRAGELLVVTPPEPLATFLDARRYLPKGIPLLKHIAALPGQTVCRTGDTISIDGSAVGAALDRDHLGRSLPIWQGCRVIAVGEVFLMNRQSVASLDGRYFGPLPTTTIVGRSDPIWIEEVK